MNLATAGDPVPKPEGLDLIAWYDLSPMRPDEYAHTNARRWTEAVTLRNAYDGGVMDARKESQAIQHMMSDDIGQVG